MDGHKPVEESDISVEKHIFAAVFRNSTHNIRPDFHFYSHDSDGEWSHKQGMKEANKLNGEQFTNRNYPEFVGYFEMPEQGIYYHPKHIPWASSSSANKL